LRFLRLNDSIPIGIHPLEHTGSKVTTAWTTKAAAASASTAPVTSALTVCRNSSDSQDSQRQYKSCRSSSHLI
jgi:hypothetical protein